MARTNKDELLAAAEALIAGEGSQGLTLSGVAQKAGISKGGLLHHFPSKQALVKALLQRMQEREDEYASQCPCPDNQTEPSELQRRLYSLCRLLQKDNPLPRSLVAAIAEDPALIDDVRRHDLRVRDKIMKESHDPVLSQILLCAAKGLFLGRILNVLNPDDPTLEDLYVRFEQMAFELAAPSTTKQTKS